MRRRLPAAASMLVVLALGLAACSPPSGITIASSASPGDPLTGTQTPTENDPSAETDPPETDSPEESTPPEKTANPEPLALGGAIPAGSRVTVVGDSIVRGLGVEPEQAWPALIGDDLGWSVTDLGCDGGGFIEPGDCGAAIGDRAEEIAETEPDVIILIASSNDLGWVPEEVASSIPIAVDAITAASPHARLIAVDSVWGPDPRPTDLDEYDAALVESVTAAGGEVLEYPDPLREVGLLAEDNVHPTVEGQKVLADTFVRAAEKAGLAHAVPRDQRATDAPDP
ncbi:SGNH/GDSL hydrolase family protein [Rathayibacter iranicus]|nr:SGNH/GDSL hydrolase family protein [Rathayibacter iranicus]MWV30908.1 hypothetical protein [Rathayibacter iranicus NCPPB 2253 = VKM Ac-1602]PWJ65948.1 GDSL-like lipase/acylhydrolase family protein [Rathayibacter iranicus NCPPB 2253 = VKM Ac-1602]